MARREATAVGSARTRVGLPIVPDGSRERPLLLRLPGDQRACNNGCEECVTLPNEAPDADFSTEVKGRHVVIRDREPTLRRDLAKLVNQLRQREPASISLLTNGRALGYPRWSELLVRAGVRHFVVKLFGLDAARHDAHTRAPGSFEQTLAGIEQTRQTSGAEVLVTFPEPLPAGTAETAETRAKQRALALELTGKEPVELPEPQVEAHANEYRFDLVTLRDVPRFVHPYWDRSFFPMVHIQTGPLCNVACVYCNVHGGTDQRLYTRQSIEAMMDMAAEHLVGRGEREPVLDLIGGEPTMHPELPALVRAAKERGFRAVYICTNGVRLLIPGYLEELLEAGLDGVRLSFHDHRPEVANRLAASPKLGARYPEVAKALLARHDLHVHIYRILLAETLDALPDYLRFVAEHRAPGARVDLMFGMPSMRGRLFENAHLYPPLERLRPAVRDALALAAELGLDPMLHHAPACLMPDDTTRASALHADTQQLDGLSGAIEHVGFEGDARYGAACQRCAGREAGCQGLPAAYFEADRDAAEAWLTPITPPWA